MIQLHRLSVAVALVFVASLAAAVPPSEKTTPAISVANADQIHPVAKLEKGELTFLDISGNPIEVVDEAKSRPLRKIADGQRPGDHSYRAVSKDGRFVTWIQPDPTVFVVQEVASGKTFEIDAGEYPGGAMFSPDGKLLAIGFTYWDPNAEGVGYSEMRLFDVKGKLLRTLDKDGPGTLLPVFSPNGKLLAVGNRNSETRLFEVASGKLLHTLSRSMSHELAFSPDGQVLAVAYVDGAVALWDVASGEMLRMQPTDADDTTRPITPNNPNKDLLTLDWSPKGDVLVTAGWGGKIVLWDSNKVEKANHRLLRKIPDGMAKLKELEAPKCVLSVRFTSDGSHLVSSGYSGAPGSDITVVIWAISE
jgi:WD40 repeat protein